MRRVFWRHSVRYAWRWFWGILDHAGRLFTVAALLGVPTVIAVGRGVWWYSLAGVLLTGLLALAEGAFQTWARFANDTYERDMALDKRREFAQRSYRWVNDVETFLESRKAGGPPPHVRGGLSGQLTAQPEPAEKRHEREAYERETVALYIERYRNEGVELFDQLVALGKIVPTNRDKVKAPRTAFDVGTATDSVQTAAERLDPGT